MNLEQIRANRTFLDDSEVLEPDTVGETTVAPETSEVYEQTAVMPEPEASVPEIELLPNRPITLNIPTSLFEDDSSAARFSGFRWYRNANRHSICLIGLGGIGSNAVDHLYKIGTSFLKIVDMDVVDKVNTSGQRYFLDQVGLHKTVATACNLSRISSTTELSLSSDAITEENCLGTIYGRNIVVCGFDNMAARKIAYNGWKENMLRESAVLEKSTDADTILSIKEGMASSLFVDGRLAGELLQVYAISGFNTDQMLRYERDCLFSDEEVADTVCSMKQTSHVAAMIGGVITGVVTNHIAMCGGDIRVLPFFTEMNFKTFQFKTTV